MNTRLTSSSKSDYHHLSVYRFGVIGQILQMVQQRRMWILLPPILALLLVGGLIALAAATPLGPMIYPLF